MGCARSRRKRIGSTARTPRFSADPASRHPACRDEDGAQPENAGHAADRHQRIAGSPLTPGDGAARRWRTLGRPRPGLSQRERHARRRPERHAPIPSIAAARRLATDAFPRPSPRCASLLLVQGVHPRVVMETLGHSHISLTMNTYSHVLPALQRDAADKMEAVLRTAT